MHTTSKRLPALALAALALGCGPGATRTPPVPSPASAPPARPSQPPQPQVSLVWGTGWSVQVRPVFSGSAIAGADGTITIVSWTNGPAALAYDLPAFTSHAARPEVVAAADGILRRAPAKGTITIPGDAVHEAVFTPPTFWPGGEASAPGPVLWLPPEVTAELRANSTARLKIVPLASGLRMRTEPATGDGIVTLSVKGKGNVVLVVNGRPTRLPAYRLVDDQGSSYTVLDSAQNPLVVRFRFGPAPVVAGKRLLLAAQSGYDVVALAGPT